MKIIENSEDTDDEPITQSKIVSVAAILLFVTAGIGSLFLIIVSTVFLCFSVRKCRVDWDLPSEYDEIDDPMALEQRMNTL